MEHNDPTDTAAGSLRRFMAHLSRPDLWKLAIAAAALFLAAFLLHRALGRFTVDDIATSVFSIPVPRLLSAAFFAAASYACLTGFDALAVRYVGRKLPYSYIALTSFASLSLGHNIGFAAVSSGAIRYRFYSRRGFGAGEVAGIIIFCGLTVGLGLAVLGGLALVTRPGLAGDLTGIDRTPLMLVGIASLSLAAGYLIACAVVVRPIVIRKFEIRLPPLRLALGQLVIGPLNFAFVAACLHQAIVGISEVPYIGIATVYVLANIATLLSHVPGGLGVIESVVLYLIPGASVVGALIVFRVVYFLIPLILGSILIATVELIGFRRSQTTDAE